MLGNLRSLGVNEREKFQYIKILDPGVAGGHIGSAWIEESRMKILVLAGAVSCAAAMAHSAFEIEVFKCLPQGFPLLPLLFKQNLLIRG